MPLDNPPTSGGLKGALTKRYFGGKVPGWAILAGVAIGGYIIYSRMGSANRDTSGEADQAEAPTGAGAGGGGDSPFLPAAYDPGAPPSDTHGRPGVPPDKGKGLGHSVNHKVNRNAGMKLLTGKPHASKVGGKPGQNLQTADTSSGSYTGNSSGGKQHPTGHPRKKKKKPVGTVQTGQSRQ
jgi:hypothetical protein